MIRLLPGPTYRIRVRDVAIELWVSKRKFPARADAIIVPVAPDLKMVFGIAKMARDYGADAVQNEANQVAPLPPGEAFIGTGARYRYRYTILAVIFDEAKRTSVPLMIQSVRHAMQQARRKGAKSILFPDMTENLLTQPTWITAEQRRATAEITARMMIDAILACPEPVPTVKIWVWDPTTADIFENELKKLEKDDLEDRLEALPVEAAQREDQIDWTEQDWVEYGRSCQIKNTVLTVVFGDPLRLKADAIARATDTTLELNAAPPSLSTGGELSDQGGVATAVAAPPEVAASRTLAARLLASGGRSLLEEMQGLGPVPAGGAAITESGSYSNVRYILHLACRTPDFPAREESIFSAMQTALTLADRNRLKTLIVPNLGAGDNDYPVESAAPIIVSAIARYLKALGRNSGIERIFLAAEDPFEDEAFTDAIALYFPLPFPVPGPADEHEL